MAVQTRMTAKNIRKELTELQTALAQSSQQKDFARKERDQLIKRFSAAVSKLKILKKQIDSAKERQTELRKKRDSLNAAVKPLIIRARQLNEEKKKIAAKAGIKGNPDLITATIQKLESKIETEALPLTEEKKVMQKIHLLRKQLAESEQIRLVLNESRSLSKQIEQTKKEANTYHKQLQDAVNEYRTELQDFIALSKEAAQIREKSEALRNTLQSSKKQMSALSKDMEQKLLLSKQIYAQKKKEQEERKRNVFATQLQSRMQEVEEKIKQGKKLTREDILVYQSMQKEG